MKLSDLVVEAVDALSIDQVLRGLIAESDLIEVVCVLDRIAHESGSCLVLSNEDKQVYPSLGG